MYGIRRSERTVRKTHRGATTGCLYDQRLANGAVEFEGALKPPHVPVKTVDDDQAVTAAGSDSVHQVCQA